MLDKQTLKELFHAHKDEISTKNKTAKKIDGLIVEVYELLEDEYGIFDMDDAKSLALCFWYNYGFLYK